MRKTREAETTGRILKQVDMKGRRGKGFKRRGEARCYEDAKRNKREKCC